MNRRAQESSREAWLPLIIVAFVLVAVIFFIYHFGLLGKLGILPDFNQSLTPATNGVVIFAYDFASERLSYYNGNDLIPFSEPLTIFKKRFAPQEVRTTFQRFIRGEAEYSTIRSKVTNTTRLITGADDFFGRKGLNYGDTFLVGSPELGAVITGFSLVVQNAPDSAVVKGVIGPYSVIHQGKIPEAPHDASGRLVDAHGLFFVYPTGEVFIRPVKKDYTGFDDKKEVDFNALHPSPSVTALRDFVIAWRDSPFMGGRSPTPLTLSYEDVTTHRPVSQAVNVEKQGSLLIVRLS